MSQPASSSSQLVLAQQHEAFRLLADPSQEVLVSERPRFSQLGPVPLHQLGADTVPAGESYSPAGTDQ